MERHWETVIQPRDGSVQLGRVLGKAAELERHCLVVAQLPWKKMAPAHFPCCKQGLWDKLLSVQSVT